MPKSVYEELRDDIVAGRFQPGFPLVEATIAEHYGVSRTPVREALLQLLRDGIVERHGRGISVATRTPEEILEIYEVRILLEGAVARWAATRRTELDLARLQRSHEDMLGLNPNDSLLKAKANATFHEHLWSASHNATLIEMLQRIIVHLSRFPETTLAYPGRWDAVLKEHTELLKAIRERRPDEADEIATCHMSAARTVRLEMYTPSTSGSSSRRR